MFPSSAPFFMNRLDARAPAIPACVEENEWGNLTVSPGAPSLARAREVFA
jgi:hypothetical protein